MIIKLADLMRAHGQRIPLWLTHNSMFHINVFCLLQKNNGNGKCLFNCCKRKLKTEVCFLGWQTINGKRRLLFQEMCSSMLKAIQGEDEVVQLELGQTKSARQELRGFWLSCVFFGSLTAKKLPNLRFSLPYAHSAKILQIQKTFI